MTDYAQWVRELDGFISGFSRHNDLAIPHYHERIAAPISTEDAAELEADGSIPQCLIDFWSNGAESIECSFVITPQRETAELFQKLFRRDLPSGSIFSPLIALHKPLVHCANGHHGNLTLIRIERKNIFVSGVHASHFLVCTMATTSESIPTLNRQIHPSHSLLTKLLRLRLPVHTSRSS